MFFNKYEPLKRESFEDVSELEQRHWIEQVSLARLRKTVYALSVLLGIAVVFLILLLFQIHNTQTFKEGQSYLDLPRNIPTPIPHDDRTIDDPMWESPEYDFYTGWLALSNDHAQEMGLPTSMEWPWDASKGVYIFHSYHSLHCVHVIRNALMEFRDNKDQTWPFSHVTHCLHTLREDITCNADDTPRYAGHLHAQINYTEFSSGIGQVRMCRDWNKLRQYSIEHSACYRRPLDRYIPLLDRYKNCPDNSKPWETRE
ncbi:Phenylalanine aminomutase (L-beta-phenylalanine forming) [Lachnellula cervina]|uniref:Phenylalanine aminomutase (L-beta-phenylalanine forming) n=1 Tax=Lachnellula cervina TaxID=1316786 RepID=A0A7D8UKD7_9HELO|nr:Phenylalanine aminomutase (L-beta-phenylalanine forming) [Lachnellula cervina]